MPEDDVPTASLERIDAAQSHAMSATMFVADFATTFQQPLGLACPVSFRQLQEAIGAEGHLDGREVLWELYEGLMRFLLNVGLAAQLSRAYKMVVSPITVFSGTFLNRQLLRRQQAAQNVAIWHVFCRGCALLAYHGPSVPSANGLHDTVALALTLCLHPCRTPQGGLSGDGSTAWGRQHGRRLCAATACSTWPSTRTPRSPMLPVRILPTPEPDASSSI